MTPLRFAAFGALALTAALNASAAHAQTAPVQYLGAGSFGFNADVTTHFESPPDEDGFRKGFSLRSYSVPALASNIGTGWGGLGAFGGAAGLRAEGTQYGYSFKGFGDTPVTFFGGVDALRTTPDVFTSIVTPGFEKSSTLATSVNAGIAFKPTSNLSLSVSGSFTQPSATTDTDLRSQLISQQNPAFRNLR